MTCRVQFWPVSSGNTDQPRFSLVVVGRTRASGDKAEMNLLYAMQATGNGHISRGRELLPALRRHAKVDTLISGAQWDKDVGLEVTYRCQGLSIAFGAAGEVRYLDTLAGLNLQQMLADAQSLPIERYDAVISDFEPVAAWAARLKGVPSIASSHQAAFASPYTPRPRLHNIAVEAALAWQAPCSTAIGFHFDRYEAFIETPLIGVSVRNATTRANGHYCVYLPFFSDHALAKRLSRIDVEWAVFSPSCKGPYQPASNITVHPLNRKRFVECLAASAGLLTGAGFQGPAEALYLGKKLLVVPARGHYEQSCNAAALDRMGVPVIRSLKCRALQAWVNSSVSVFRRFPDNLDRVIDKILAAAANQRSTRRAAALGKSSGGSNLKAITPTQFRRS